MKYTALYLTYLLERTTSHSNKRRKEEKDNSYVKNNNTCPTFVSSSFILECASKVDVKNSKPSSKGTSF